MLYETVTETPRIAAKDYATKYSDQIVPDEGNCDFAMTFRGTGISIAEHPLRESAHMRGCANCEGEDVLVIYAQWSVSTASGDVYWDHEIVCNKCGMFTARSFSDND
ncbi:MAG: hypothetical protein ACFFAY_10635 [Promethearchaeota archaeon]